MIISNLIMCWLWAYCGCFRCFGNALGNCIHNKEYLIAINKIPKQVRHVPTMVALCVVWMLNLSSLVNPLQPTPPLDPAQTKRTDGEPTIEKARLSSLARDDNTTGSSRNPLVLSSRNQNRSEGRSRASEVQTLVSPGAGSSPQPDQQVKKENLGWGSISYRPGLSLYSSEMIIHSVG